MKINAFDCININAYILKIIINIFSLLFFPQHLYNYVFVHEAAPDDFQIVTNFPRKVLPCQPNYCSDSSATETKDPPTFTEAGLGKSEMLFVHDNEA